MTRRSSFSDVFDLVSRRVLYLGGAEISKLHSDGAKEYRALQNDLGRADEDKNSLAPYTMELNHISERVNRTLKEAARALLI